MTELDYGGRPHGNVNVECGGGGCDDWWRWSEEVASSLPYPDRHPLGRWRHKEDKKKYLATESVCRIFLWVKI